MTLDDTQLAAVAFASSRRLSLVTGGAGTGKTTIVREIAAAVPHPVLCSFAGKAAARLREATCFPASTIHSLLRYNGATFAAGPLHGKSVIVDEASMLPSALLYEIVSREPARLVLVGDAAQLPPVGKGQPFHDLLALRPGLSRELTTCYRATEAIHAASREIRAGNVPRRILQTAAERYEFRPTGAPPETHRAILSLAETGEIDFAQDVVIVPRNGTGPDDPCTVASLNAALRPIANPRHDPERRIDIGDRVINTKNQPDADVWNGTTGTVHAIDDEEGVIVKLDFPATDQATGEPTEYITFDRQEMAPHLHLAYALTVHKAQGSQYRRVVTACLDRDAWALLDRALLYTAVTRAREQCLVVGNPAAFASAVSRVSVRHTVMQQLAGGHQQ